MSAAAARPSSRAGARARPWASSAVLACALSACARDPVSPPGSVLLLTIDTLRADHVGLYGHGRETTPRIDRFFAEGAVHLRAYAAETSTSPSVVSMLSGRLPQEHGVRLFFQLLPDETALVPDLLPPAYQTAAVVSNMVLTDEAIGLAGRFDHYDDAVDRRESGRRFWERDAAATTAAALRWLEELRDPARPFFLWVHYIDPHAPYRPPQDWPLDFAHEGRLALEAERIPSFTRLEGVDDALEYVDRYDAEIAFTDRHVGALLEAFAQRCPPEESLVLLTSDHGEALTGRERWFSHGFNVWEELARVPLLLRGRGVAPGRFERAASGVDVAATILAFAGAPAPQGSSGLDLREPAARDAPPRAVFFEATKEDVQWRAAVQGDAKWVLSVRGPERVVGEQRFHDLAADPGELAPVTWEGTPPAAARLLELVRADPDPAGIPVQYRAGLRLDAPKVAPRASAEQLEALRGLGYAE